MLGLTSDDHIQASLRVEVDFVEGLFSTFTTEETIILCLDDASNDDLRALFNQQLSMIPDYAYEAENLISALKSKQGPLENIARELVAYFIGHTRARETYIDGLLQYAEVFHLRDMADHWSTHFELTQTIVDEAKELLIELNHTDDYSNHLLHRVYEHAVLIPASLRCQMHDMIRILHLDSPEMTFEDAFFAEEEAEEWTRLGVSAEQAGYWRAYDIDPEEFVSWIEYGFHEPRTAGSWKVRGFDPFMADGWALAGFDPVEADMYRQTGCTEPEQAQSLQNIVQ